MLAIMAEADPIGTLSLGSKAMPVEALARITGGLTDEVVRLLEELGANDVFSRDARGRIFSRRMVRDAKKSQTAQKNGRLGGNPNLGKHDDIPPSDNPQVKAQDKGGVPPNGSPESRVQKPVVESQPVSRSEIPTITEPAATISAIDKNPGPKSKPAISPELFETWWLLVPRKKAKGAARRAFTAALKRADIKTLTEGIQRYADERRGEDPQFTVHPATWLNGDRWSDERPAAGNGGGRPSGNNGRGLGWVIGTREMRARRGNPDNVPGVGPAHGVPPVYAETPPAPARKRPGPLPGPDPGETVIEPDGGNGNGRPADAGEDDDSIPF